MLNFSKIKIILIYFSFLLVSLFCKGVLSTSKSKYDPPCKSRPRLTFFFKKKSSLLIKLEILKNIKEKQKTIIEIIFNLEKYNT